MNKRDKAKLAKIESRCCILTKVILAIRSIHHDAEHEQKAFLETMIGAAIWYIPKPIDAWTGFISVALLESFLPDNGVAKPKISEEHVYPRKVAAKILLEDSRLNATSLQDIFCNKFGRLHYITPDENKAARNHQRSDVFSTPEEVYRQANIHLIEVDKDDLKLIKKRDRPTIEKCLNSRNPTKT